MYVHRSNRIERLVDVLAEVVSDPLPDPFEAERIAVQGRGMERWLSMQLARRFGVWANPDFPFPRHLVQRQLGVVLGEETLDPAFEPQALRWSIAARLPALLQRDEFKPLRLYLDADKSPYRLIELAERIAFLFDQYVVYRPELVSSWERGAESYWQAELWRALTAGGRPRHFAACAVAFQEALRRRAPLPELPKRLSLFGLSTLAPLYLQILKALSPHCEVHLFVLSPSREFWAQIRSRREALRSLPPARAEDDLEEALRQEAGNPLLASLGRLGREFQEVLEANVDYREDEADLYVEPEAATMLGVIQADMLALRYRGARSLEAPPRIVDDHSIAVHACHNAMREVEVLHDQLRHLLESDETLEPRDIIVMSPAIDEYAPLIDAVFGGDDEAQRIPYRIADRRVQVTDEVVHAFMAALAAMGSRLTASQVVDLLELDPVRERFGISPPELEDIRGWIKDSGIRWGIDARHRRSCDQPEIDANTWRFGLDRLFLGYAMAGEGRRLYAGVLPFDDIEGTAAVALGALAQFCDVLFTWHRELERPRGLEQWRLDLERMLEETISAFGARAYQHQEIRTVLAELAQHARSTGFDVEIDLDTMRHCLDGALDEHAPGRNFLGGGVTFCALVPMRTVPFEVVCLLGMNDETFPRAQRSLGFDLMARKPRPGDRSARDDDRYLFLEALLSARRRLIITYVGQSVHDHSERPPSVVVSELLDTVDESFRVPATDDPPAKARRTAGQQNQLNLFEGVSAGDPVSRASAHLVVKHPLQGFSPRYFRSPRAPGLISYSRRHHAAALALTSGHGAIDAPFVAAPLPAGVDEKRAVTVDELVRFFENPARAFLQKRLALSLGGDLEILADREPIELNDLERWKVGDELVRAILRGEDLSVLRPLAAASGQLPPGKLGVCELHDVEAIADAIAAATRRLRSGDALPALEIDTEVDGTRLTGFIRDRWPAGYSQYQYSRIGRRRELGVWLRHLLVNLVAPVGESRDSYLVGRGENEAATVHFTPVDRPAEVLGTLVQLYRFGLTCPLPLFDGASRVYAETIVKQGGQAGRTTAIEKATGEYDGGEYRRGDCEDAYVEQAFRGRRPVSEDDAPAGTVAGIAARFSEVALAVYLPFLQHREVSQ